MATKGNKGTMTFEIMMERTEEMDAINKTKIDKVKATVNKMQKVNQSLEELLLKPANDQVRSAMVAAQANKI
jgi:hypothetical protein